MDLKDAAAAERAVDIKRVVSNLRKQRAGMVQTPGQYLFCHQVVPLANPFTMCHWLTVDLACACPAARTLLSAGGKRGDRHHAGGSGDSDVSCGCAVAN